MQHPKSATSTPLPWILTIRAMKGYSHSFRITCQWAQWVCSWAENTVIQTLRIIIVIIIILLDENLSCGRRQSLRSLTACRRSRSRRATAGCAWNRAAAARPSSQRSCRTRRNATSSLLCGVACDRPSCGGKCSCLDGRRSNDSTKSHHRGNKENGLTTSAAKGTISLQVQRRERAHHKGELAHHKGQLAHHKENYSLPEKAHHKGSKLAHPIGSKQKTSSPQWQQTEN